MTKIEELKAAYEAATPGEWKACREHEDFDGPMFDIDEWEQAEYAARPFVYICASAQRVTNNHDLFQFDEANARLITLMHNTLPALLEAVEALKEIKEHATPYNNDDTAPMDQAWVRWRCDEVLEKLS